VTLPSTPRRRTARQQDVFAWLTEAGFTGVGVPASLGGTGGGREEALCEVTRLQQTDLEAAAVLASHQCVIGALLAGRNVALRDNRISALARGDRSGV
jgi:alkylation response protein AidB-like acyl-CoA dehydrogenase